MCNFVEKDFPNGPEMAAKMKEGTRVVRGKDWKYGNQVKNNLITKTCCQIPVFWSHVSHSATVGETDIKPFFLHNMKQL